MLDRTNRYYDGPVSDHFDGVRFRNLDGGTPKGFRQFLKWQLAEPSTPWPRAYPSPHAQSHHSVSGALPAGVAVRVSFIGHASFLLQSRDVSVLIDPVFSDRASPSAWLGPRRVNPPAFAIDALPKIDAVLVTHNHYDHMDMPALRRLWRRDRPKFITPLGNDTILRKGIGAIDAVATDWGSVVALDPGLTVHCVPTQHWSARRVGDRMHALWASFVVQMAGRTIYAVGDSGYGDGSIFRGIGAEHSSIDLALLPIGAYEPRWFMRGSHMNPDDAVRAFLGCGARLALGHHWGTFRLTNEAIDNPPKALAHALATHGVAAERFVAAQPGGVVDL